LSGRPLVFLSHAGIDTDRAKELKKRLENAPDCRAKNLKVWFDKDDLIPGSGWQTQLEEVIEKHATAFVVYVGSRGVINWVESEIRLALSRAVSDKNFPFIPVIAKEVIAKEVDGAAVLPGFARQFQGLMDVENDGTAFERLVAALLGTSSTGSIKAENEPFFGLKAIDEERSYLFFGREKETQDLLTRLRQNHLIMVIGDSGSGKSSLVRAGVVSQWRGGALAEPGGLERNESYWHVIEFRPGRDPWQSLGEAVFRAADQLGLSAADGGTYVGWATGTDPKLIRIALRCGLAADRTRTLIVIDQFEELFTARIEQEERRRFADLLVALSDDPAFYIAVTMRRDYYNLLAAPETRSLYNLVESEGRQRVYSLRRMTDEGLRRIVLEPLKLTDENPKQAAALASAVLADVGERAGDLALVEFALTKAWERRRQSGGTLLESYAAIKGVEGALAGEAERVFCEALGGEKNEAEICATLIRLAQVTGGTGPARRLARRREFSESRWKILQLLASREGNRLVLIGGQAEKGSGDEVVEIAHEALFTRWPRLFAWLNATLDDKRVLENLTERAIAWADAPQEKRDSRLAKTDSERESFEGLAIRNGHWLSAEEKGFVDASVEANRLRLEADKASRERERKLRKRAVMLASIAGVLAVLAGSFAIFMYLQQQLISNALADAQRSERQVRLQQSRLLARFANEEVNKGNIFSGARYAIAGLDRLKEDKSLKSEATSALSAAAAQILPNLVARHADDVLALGWDPKNQAVLSLDRKLMLDNRSYEQAAAVARFRPVFPASADSDQGTIAALAVTSSNVPSVAVVRHVSAPGGNSLQVWQFDADGTKGQQLCSFKSSLADLSVKWAPDDQRIAIASGNTLGICSRSNDPVWIEVGNSSHFAWSPRGDQLVFTSARGVEVLSNLSDVNSRVQLQGENVFRISAIAWAPDGKQIMAAVSNQLWNWMIVDGAWGKPEQQKGTFQGQIVAVEWAPDSDRLLIIADNYGYPSRELRPSLWIKSKQTRIALEIETPRSVFGPDRGPGSTYSAAWAKDGRLATLDTFGIDRIVRVRDFAHDAAAPSIVLNFGRREQRPIDSVAWTEDGRLAVAAVVNSEVHLWLLSKEIHANAMVAPNPSFDADRGHISSDGSNLVVSAQNGSILFSKAVAGATGVVVQPSQRVPKFLNITPDGDQMVLVTKVGEIFHLRRSTGEVRSAGQIPSAGGEFEPVAAALSNDGSRLALVTRNPGKLWDCDLKKHVCTEMGLTGYQSVSSSAMAWSYDGSALAVSLSGGVGSAAKLSLFHYDAGKTPGLREVPLADSNLGNSEDIYALAWSPGGKLAAAISVLSDGRPSARRLVIWTTGDKALRVADDAAGASWIDLRWQGEDSLIAAIRDEPSSRIRALIVSYEGDSFTPGKPFRADGEFIGFLASPSGPAYRAALFRYGCCIISRDLKTAAETNWTDFGGRPPDYPVWSWAPSGVLVWYDRDDGQVTAFDGTQTQELQPSQHLPLALAVSESGQIASVSYGRSLRVWKDPHAPPETIDLPRRSYNTASVAWAPNGKYLAVSQGRELTMIFARRENGALDKPVEWRWGQALAWSKNSKLAVGYPGSDGLVIEVCEDMSSCNNSKRFSFPGLIGDPSQMSLFWSDDSKKIAVVVSTRDLVRIVRFELDGPANEFTEIARADTSGQPSMGAWSPDDRYVAASIGQRVYIWPVAEINGLIASIDQRIAQTELTPDEKRNAGFTDLR
jgi:WD40 repeat protein